MTQRVLPLFQYPTTTAWVDDDEIFLRTVSCTLYEPQKHNHIFFNYSDDCINFFSTYNPPSKLDFLNPERKNENYLDRVHLLIDFDISLISKLKDMPKKMNEIAVLICDYKMPKMNGLELCHKFKRLPFKKILLTGKMQEDGVIPAFNDGVIDKYIKKGNLHLVNELERYIKVLTRQYFCEITAPLLVYLESDCQSPLSDKLFVNFFDDWCKKNKIQEFYLIDKNGSFLTIDDSGKQKFFVVHTDKSLNDFIETCSDITQAKKILKKVKNYEAIPFFGIGNEAWQIDIDEWGKYFHEATVFEGRERYYIAHKGV